jgi:hypothetical protein
MRDKTVTEKALEAARQVNVIIACRLQREVTEALIRRVYRDPALKVEYDWRVG